jgi:hypothetical protein
MPRGVYQRKKAPKKAEEIKVEPKVEEQVKQALEDILEPQKTEWRVLDRYLKYVRTYSLEVHGKDAEEKAKGFAKKIGGWCN